MNLLPSFFFPLIAKKISFFFIFFELIEALFNLIKLFTFLASLCSFRIFTFKSFERDLFLSLIEFKIIFLSEKKIFLLPKS